MNENRAYTTKHNFAEEFMYLQKMNATELR